MLSEDSHGTTPPVSGPLPEAPAVRDVGTGHGRRGGVLEEVAPLTVT